MTIEQKSARASTSTAKCIRWLGTGLGIGVLYPLLMLAISVNFIAFPVAILTIFWGAVKLALATAVFCLYKSTGVPKIGLAAMLLAASAVLSITLSVNFIAIIADGLAMVGISLILWDLGKAFPMLKLDIAGGIIFLGVIFSILNNPTMGLLGLAALLIGMLFASARLSRLQGQALSTGA